MHLLLSATLSKWANIMVAAAEGHTSRYALNQEEYLKLAEDIQKSTGIELTITLHEQPFCIVFVCSFMETLLKHFTCKL